MFLEKRGYLYKQGGKHKSWHLRYFVLQPGMFTYYKNDPVSVYTVFVLGIHCFCLSFLSPVMFSLEAERKSFRRS